MITLFNKRSKIGLASSILNMMPPYGASTQHLTEIARFLLLSLQMWLF